MAKEPAPADRWASLLRQEIFDRLRKMADYERLSGIVAGPVLAQLLQAVRLYVNFFQPSFKFRARGALVLTWGGAGRR